MPDFLRFILTAILGLALAAGCAWVGVQYFRFASQWSAGQDNHCITQP